MDPLDPQFDDPALRSALRRALGSETAPVDLRRRITESLRAEQKPVSPARWAPIFGLAAVLLIGVGVGLWVAFGMGEKSVPEWFAAGMATTHDRCSALPDHHLLIEMKSDEAIALRKSLETEFNYPVFVPSPGDGWKFDGAGKCRVGVFDTAHLVFTHGDESISVFSVRATALGSYMSGSDTRYAQTENGHFIAGFVENGIIHCLVGTSKSGDLGLKDVIKLRDQWRAAYGANLAHTNG